MVYEGPVSNAESDSGVWPRLRRLALPAMDESWAGICGQICFQTHIQGCQLCLALFGILDSLRGFFRGEMGLKEGCQIENGRHSWWHPWPGWRVFSPRFGARQAGAPQVVQLDNVKTRGSGPLRPAGLKNPA